MRRLLLTLLTVLLIGVQLFAQNRTISGRVTDERGNPVPNASVVVKGTTIGTTANADGRYTITVPADARTLVISSVEAGQLEVSIGTQATVNATLRGGDRSLTEVVVTGYTTRRRTEFTGSTAKVESKAIEQVPMASFEQILQGRAPGLYIASGSGQPGAAARVNIRGVGSINGGNDPLYVLDGIPIEAAVFRTLNPNDFESVEVLKDAAGAGQYGSRGANGVIVITSKKGRAGRTVIGYRGMAGVSEPPSLRNVRLMNTAERLQYEEQVLGQGGVISGVSNTGGNPVLGSNNGLTGYPGWDYSPLNPRYQLIPQTQRDTEARLLDSIRGINTNWADYFFRKGTFQQHEVNASGGAGNFSFYTSLSAYQQEGVIIRSDLDRYTFRGNLDFRTDRLTVAIRSAAGWSSLSGIESEAGVALANPVAAAFLELPYRRLFNTTTGKPLTGGGLTGSNAYDRLFTTTNVTNQFKGNLGITVAFNIWNGIGFRTTNGIDWRNNNTSRFIDPTSFAGGNVAQGAQGSYNEGNSENLQLISTSGFTYNKNIGSGKHVINAQVMMELIRNRFRSFNATGFGINANLPNTPAGITAGSATNNFIPLTGGSKTVNGLFSTFLIADYTYSRKYTFSGTLRRDAPSQVPEANRNNIYWSVGGSWNIAEENFFKNQNVFQDLRLRASYGETANINGFPSDFGYISTYGSGSYAGIPAIVPTSPGNLDYRPESQVQTNVGLEFGMFNRRLRAAFDYYIKDSRNLFVTQNLSRTTGFTALSTNAGQVRNRGFEFKIDGDVVRSRDLVITLGVNGGFNDNKVTSLGLLSEIPAGTGIIRVGYPIGSHFAVGYLGVDPQSGLPVYQDLAGNPTSIYSASNNRAEFGTYLPSFVGGASLDVTYGNFSLSALFSTAQDVYRFNNEAFFYETTTANIQFNKRVDMLTQIWQKPGDITNYQRVTAPREFSSRDIQDASFVRFRNLQLGYVLDLKRTKIANSVRFWVQGQNLYTWTKWQGFDPEESNNIATYEFPNPRTYTVGLDLNF